VEKQIKGIILLNITRTCMKLPAVILALCLLTGTAAALSLPQFASLPHMTGTDLVPVASSGGGQRFQAGDYPVIVLSGTYREMGRQYGTLMKTELNEEYAFLLSKFARRNYTQEQMRQMAREAWYLYPQRQKEIFNGMAETSGLMPEDILLLYNGLIFSLIVPPRASCSYMAVWGNFTTDGSVVASRNWDLDDSLIQPFDRWYVLAVYRPSDGSNRVATFGPAGMRPETLMNSKGLFIADDNAGISDAVNDGIMRPDMIAEFFRFMLDYPDLDGLNAGIAGAHPDVPWIVDIAGPEKAYVYEVMSGTARPRTGDGVVAAANHFVDPAWNLTTPPAAHSLSRYNNLLRQAEEAKGSIDAVKMMQIRDVRWEDGGATFMHSVLFSSYPDFRYSSDHQVVFVPETRTLWIKVMEKDWQKVELGPLFGT
jgi:hypothetical protein